jgi:hydroxyethylthiazole kinase-like uncharacterized protein yjeF
MSIFDPRKLKALYKPPRNSNGEDNGQVTIIGGSKLFHGAPLFSLTVASRVVDMVFFASPDESVGRVAERLKSSLFSFIWVPWAETESYIQKSDAILIGPGFMRFRSEKTHLESDGLDKEGEETRKITEKFLKEFSEKRWVIDAGSLQTMEASWIPRNAILTPNKKEFEMLFGNLTPQEAARKFNCVIVLKGPTTLVCSSEKCTEVRGGNPGLTKGGTGDVQAGLTVALLAKNDPFLAACAASYVVKVAADELSKRVGTFYNSDDLAKKVPEVLATF